MSNYSVPVRITRHFLYMIWNANNWELLHVCCKSLKSKKFSGGRWIGCLSWNDNIFMLFANRSLDIHSKTSNDNNWDDEAGFGDSLIESDEKYYKTEFKICHIPILRIICLYFIINTIWSSVDFNLSVCTKGAAFVCWVTVITVGLYAVWATFYDVPVIFPPTYTWVYVELRKTFKYPNIIPMMFVGYQSTLFGIAVFLVLSSMLLAYVEWSQLFDWTCDDWLIFSGRRRWKLWICPFFVLMRQTNLKQSSEARRVNPFDIVGLWHIFTNSHLRFCFGDEYIWCYVSFND